ncbi:RDD family protein [Thalassotalea sp. Y01]|uniref:RDD family protein n=1 Tax=Thalassotalea sp. Y01 TaxID=2729613 RepID=UPI0020071970|nr:RDD family protein [Thalassotalea sp. Y01]
MKKLFGKTRKKLTFDETQEIITPFAFTMNEGLFGTPIASPYKRGIAILIDLLLIAMLSNAGGEFLAIAISIMAFRLGSRKRAQKQGKVKGNKRRALMRLIGAFIVLVVLLDNFAPMVNKFTADSSKSEWQEYTQWQEENNGANWQDKVAKTKNNNGQDIGKEVGVGTALQVTGYIIKVASEASEKQCKDRQCWYDILQDVPKHALKLDLNNQQASELIGDIIDSLDIDGGIRPDLQTQLSNDFDALYAEHHGAETASNTPQTIAAENEQGNDMQSSDNSQTAREPAATEDDQAKPEDVSSAIENTELGQLRQAKAEAGDDQPRKPIYSMMEYIKAIIDDLGLGFGWAAFYFTVFTSWWQGQTPGKRLMGIRVLQLDGTPLSIWDSFGRYGGYGAGLATGLLGFFQIYWDPNRQAIHDKISATVVIDERKKVDEAVIAMAREKLEKKGQASAES